MDMGSTAAATGDPPRPVLAGHEHPPLVQAEAVDRREQGHPQRVEPESAERPR